jgi:DNA-binding response OmpR family regulator
MAMILIVDDDLDIREILELTLQFKGYTVEGASNGREALAVLERTRPCLMVLDLVMPEMTGWQLLEEMKERKLGDIPVCVISALEGRTPSEAVASLCKPFEPSELLAIVARYCRHPARTTTG